MQHLFYSTGQVARQLGTTLAAVRVLCENRVIAAETTPGGHWRVPASEVERLKHDGVPPIPRPLATGSAPPPSNDWDDYNGQPELLEEPSEEVRFATDQVAITRSMLEKRKLERDIEENEDWFRERQQRQSAAAGADRQRREAKQAEQRRLGWIQEWTQYALNSLPYGAQREVEMEVHTTVQEILSDLQPSQPAAITRRLVDAAVHRALGPWTRKRQASDAPFQTALPSDAAGREQPAQVSGGGGAPPTSGEADAIANSFLPQSGERGPGQPKPEDRQIDPLSEELRVAICEYAYPLSAVGQSPPPLPGTAMAASRYWHGPFWWLFRRMTASTRLQKFRVTSQSRNAPKNSAIVLWVTSI